MPRWLHVKTRTDQFCDFWVVEELTQHQYVPKVKLVGGTGGGFLDFGLCAFLEEFDVDGHPDVHCVDSCLLIFFSTAASLRGLSLYSQRREFNSMLRCVILISARTLSTMVFTSCSGRTIP